jgi:hypothetical protein
MEAYCDEVRRLEDKFFGLELNHIARRYNETADELAKIASGRTTVPPDVFSRDLHQPSVKVDDTPEPEAPSAQPEAPSAQPEAPSAQPEAPSVRPEVPSAPGAEALHVDPAHDPTAPVWRDGQCGRKWAGSNDGGRRAGAAVTSSARLTSHPGTAREPPPTA